MKSIARRIQRLEERLLPAPETEDSRRVREWIEKIRRQREMRGDSASFDDLPIETAADGSNEPLSIAEILIRGRKRAHLRNLQNQDSQNLANDRPNESTNSIAR